MSDSTEPVGPPDLPDRRVFLATLAGTGLAGSLFPGALWAGLQAAGEITEEVVERAEVVAGLSLTPGERSMLLARLRRHREWYGRIRDADVPFELPPALTFHPEAIAGAVEATGLRPAGVPDATDPAPGSPEPVPDGPGAGDAASATGAPAPEAPPIPSPRPDLSRPASDVDLAYASVTEQSSLLRRGLVSSVELTELYLDRLRRHGPSLECVVTLTEELAMEQARRADGERERGIDRGPLHGVPWGAKDLLAVRGHPTTWGAAPFRNQSFGYDATVVRRLEEAGAVLVAKLTLGALAMGDVWFGGRTRNPWNPSQGSSGSSAGPAAATAAGLVGFALGSETLGSIVSPSVRCGVTGLRPTFGRVSRYGAMPLSWSMDKLGPLCRSAEDAALVLHAVHGTDPRDPSTVARPFGWDGRRSAEGLRVGVYEEGFASDEATDLDRRVPAVLEGLGLELVAVELPRELPTGALRVILDAEAGAAFDALTRTDRDDELVRQDEGAWPNTLRASRFVPAVEYIQANRIRSALVGAMESALAEVDVLVTPSFADPVLLLTNLTGHPSVVVPHGFASPVAPVGITFVGRLWGESEILRVARAFQEATGHHLRRPPLFS